MAMRILAKDLYSPLSLLGWFVLLLKPIGWGLTMLSDYDLFNSYSGPIGKFLETSWGTLGSVVLGAAIIGFAIYKRSYIQIEANASQAALSPSKNEGNDNTVDLTILVEWSRSKLPEIFPPSGKIGTVGFWSHASAGLGSAEASGTPGSKAPEWGLEMQKEVHLCHITNNGEKPIFHVQIEFTVIYHAIIEDNNGIRSGDVLGSSQWPLHILQLAPLPQGGSYDLYF